MPTKQINIDISVEEAKLLQMAEQSLRDLYSVVHILPRDEARVVKRAIRSLSVVFLELEHFSSNGCFRKHGAMFNCKGKK